MCRSPLVVVVLAFVLLLPSCSKDSPTGNDGRVTEEPGWYSLGLEDHLQDHYITQICLDYPYLYVAAAGDGLFRKDLGASGSTWDYLGFANTTGKAGHYVSDVAVLDNGDILVSQHTGVPNAPGLHRSTDNGATWERWDAGIASESIPYASSVTRLSVAQSNGQTVYAAAYGIYRSENSGQTWSLLWGNPAGGASFFKAIACHPSDCSIVWAGGDTPAEAPFLLSTTDGGSNWGDFTNVIPPLMNSVFSIVMDPVDTDIVYVGLGRNGMLKTTDGGETWAHPADFAEGAVIALAADHATSGHLFIAKDDVLYETWDGGDSAEAVESPMAGHIRDMLYDSTRHTLYIGTSSGIYKLVVE